MDIKNLRVILLLITCISLFHFNIHVWGNNSPVVAINGPYNGPVDVEIAFSSEGTTDSDGIIVEYLWSFGDGETSSEKNPSHIYVEEGVYTVQLTVRDNAGGLGVKETYCMAYSIPNRHPIISINGPYEGKASTAIQFTSNGTYDPDNDSMEYLWDLGDGSQSHLKNTIHSYPTSGTSR